MSKVSVVIPNWNGARFLPGCLDSLQKQSAKAEIIVVDNGSVDESVELISRSYPGVKVVGLPKNRGFAGGVNAGIKQAMADGADFVALLNNDAIAETRWLQLLVEALKKDPKLGITTSKMLGSDGKHLDSTGDIYTIWGLPYPRGRGEANTTKYDKDVVVFGASGGASLYRAKMLQQIGLFDEDFFAYYEDVDLSFRAQLAGWKVAYVPQAVVDHQIGASSAKIKGFATYHTLKNLPLLFWKNVPWALMPKVWPRLAIAWSAIAISALRRGQIGPFVRAILVGALLWPKKLWQRRKIQKNRKVSTEYINSIIDHDLPPNARRLRKLRAFWRKLLRKTP